MSDIEIRIEGHAGRITLTRPKALNAVTWDMVRKIDAALQAWEQDDQVKLVVIDAEGDKAFAAGGDIVDLYNTGKAGDVDFGRRFWAEEYRLNARIRSYCKPYIALMHGFVMGGGVGISCHGTHRVVDDSVQIALPECGIGLVPDVGSSWLLARTGFGAMIGLTGYRMGPADAITAGFADHYIPKSQWPEILRDLASTGRPDVLVDAQQTPAEGNFANWPDIPDIFATSSLNSLLSDLEAQTSQTALKWAKTLRRQSPLACACALRLIHGAGALTFEEALRREYRFVHRCMEQGDFLEGIRAQVIDKDRAPQWRHASVADLPPEQVEAMLAPLGDAELSFGKDTA